MLSLHFNVSNPWSNRFKSMGSWFGNAPVKHKSWEIELNKNNDVIGMTLRITTRQSHAGIFLAVSLFGFEAVFNYYDNRHWVDEKNCWEDYNV